VDARTARRLVPALTVHLWLTAETQPRRNPSNAKSLRLSQPRSGCAPSAGQDGPAALLGPLCGGEAGSTGRVAGVDRDVDSFSPGQESGRKARPRLTDLPLMARAWMPELRQRRSSCPMGGKRQAGWPSLLVTFLLLRASCPPPFGPASLFAHASCVRVATQEKSDPAAKGRRKLLLYA